MKQPSFTLGLAVIHTFVQSSKVLRCWFWSVLHMGSSRKSPRLTHMYSKHLFCLSVCDLLHTAEFPVSSFLLLWLKTWGFSIPIVLHISHDWVSVEAKQQEQRVWNCSCCHHPPSPLPAVSVALRFSPGFAEHSAGGARRVSSCYLLCHHLIPLLRTTAFSYNISVYTHVQILELSESNQEDTGEKWA